MRAPARVSEEYEAQKRLTVATTLAVRDQWGRMGGDWWRSLEKIMPGMLMIVTASQIAAARQGAQYVPEVLEAQGQHPEAVARVNPESLAGVASDGRALESLLAMAVVRSKSSGDLLAGRSFLDSVVSTQIADAHRASIQLGTIARPSTGYVRMVNTPCCKDCAILAGKWFKSNTGFDRHPNCKCYHLPTTDPNSEYAEYPDPDDITGITEAEREALKVPGVSPSQVLNAGRGRSLSERRSKMSTLEGTTRKGWYGGGYAPGSAPGGVVSAGAPRRQGAVKGYRTRRVAPRLTPDGIYARTSDPAEARKLLAQYGYLDFL